jgi:D-lactate dehydrogenase (cytochrome)
VNAALPTQAADRAAAVAALAARFGDALSTNAGVRDSHGRGEGMSDAAPPDAVLFARSTAEVADAVRLCSAHAMPVIPHGAGSSLEGQLLALSGGLSLDLTGMDRILAVNPDDLDCHVETGVTREALNAHLRDMGLFMPLDPGANATLGGMAATRASGTNAVRYGTMREVTLGLTVVTPQGEIIHTGGRARKSSAGYDLTRLYVGSEGTLGVITELRLRLFGIPETIAAAVVQFASVEGAVAAVTQTLQLGVPIARIELLDALQMRACIAWSKLDGLAETPTLFLEFHGSPAAVAEQVETVRALAEANGGGQFRWADTAEARSKLWKARHEGYHAARGLAPGKAAFATDACVPIASLGAAIAEATAKAAELGLLAPVIGHVGDGNFHMLVLHDPADAAETARAEALAEAVTRIALTHGGTITGEHGVGVHKLGAMAAEHGPALHVMAAIKRALDPQGIMNPGKTVPAAAFA